ncbi:Beta-galactosidase [Vitis vinifera]|uniref:beta-galactosidase n=1 Tax=Vitis vinifera TaxID=29760 RepID=A0A438CGF2_VITVI|nr:Beta-galactosidase [Vitis vinifera]
MKYVWIEESPNTASDCGVAPPKKGDGLRSRRGTTRKGSDGRTREVGRLVGVRRSWRRRRVAGKCLTRPHAPAREMQPPAGKWRVSDAWMLFWCRCLHKSWRSPPGAPSGIVGVGKIGRRKSSPAPYLYTLVVILKDEFGKDLVLNEAKQYQCCEKQPLSSTSSMVGLEGRDSSRLLHYEGGGARTPSTDIVCPMYMRVWDIVKIAKDPTETRPLILCEYSHSMGNSNGNIQEYWEAIDNTFGLQGGFIWDWVDQV